MADRQTAAFFRLEGTLTHRPTLAASAWMVLNAQSIRHRITRLGSLFAAAPLSLLAGTRDEVAVRRLAWMGLRDMSEDRLHVLGEEYEEEQLQKSLVALGLELVKRARKDGHRVILVSDNLDVIVKPLAKRLHIDDVMCNVLEMRGGKATGRLADPVIAGQIPGQFLRHYAIDHGLDLERSLGFGASSGDGLLLSAIGKPCAVNPDRTLRRMARDHEWPIVDSPA